ncbi:GntR family transcriptional regulator/MocR family aminotransferase [Herbihabitans rhizosphaerae]|uniref:GntR family transcriptional regulator/MocR family aminotransferase n=1 Tax=Herbihabitans rhizosphaerae TaxID=1872711 RepID=A0A4V2ERR1_9PSEU|nr:PLP-dependent aminotransferase family protein [Herbihabitans rhizosphaerae]RZS32829.1 GntR family transcriptional regulator/MocR family aminotransferase [Herbihabitans rhizosphaerae]
MTESWVNVAERIGSDLHLELAGTGGRRAVLAEALREAVRSGRLAPGTRLPPYRSLAADLGLARNTVADAYAELVAEGWLVGRQGSGTRVAPRTDPVKPLRRKEKRPGGVPGPVHLLRSGQPDAASFPRSAWVTAARRALTAVPNEAFGPGDPRGRPDLRAALADYLSRARGVRTDADRVVICSGFGHALQLLFGAGVLRGPVSFDSYGLWVHRELLERAGARTVPQAVDDDGVVTSELVRHKGIRVAMVTAAHQFPLGGALHSDRRVELVEWARARGGVILEDDYDGEFRYDRQPVGALQGLDPDRVIYAGSVSKSLSPAVRVGWLVLPEHLVDDVAAAKGERESWTSVPDQLTLAELITSGAYDRHLRRMRQRYRQRRDQLVHTLAERVPHIEVTGIAAGLHAVLRLPSGTERTALLAARWQGIALEGLSTFRHPRAVMPTQDGLVVGYAAPTDSAYASALEALCRVLEGVSPG